ncbi:hypothetical protein, partial [Rhizobium leguminosarum]|uniref:hypothetical protein n=1 Tax=Rhizobium leguminosarum TaxID=384 RepID=UPI0013F3E641
ARQERAAALNGLAGDGKPTGGGDQAGIVEIAVAFVASTTLFQETDIQPIHFPRNHFSTEKPKILRENVIKKNY